MSTVKTDLTKNSRITSVEEALDASNLNFIAETSELMSPTTGVFAPDHQMILRSDTNDVLGVVGKKYHPTQNSLAFAFADSIVKNNDFHYTEAISKDNGAVSIITAQSARPDTIRLNDEVCRQIKFINGFNGKTSLSIEFSMLRLVCTNGMTRSEKESVIRFKHTVRIQNRMEVSLKIFDDSVKFHDEFVATSKLLAQKAVDKTMVEKFLAGLYSDSKQNDSKKETIIDLFQNGKGNNGSSLFDLVNGVSEYTDHFHGKDENRVQFSTFGAGVKLKNKSWDLAVSML